MKEGWQIKSLADVCLFRSGGTPSKAVENYWRGNIPWVSPKDMKSDVVSDSIDHISEEAIDGSATALIPKDSVLIVVRSGILARTIPIAIAGRSLTINQDLKALIPSRAIDSRFLYYLLTSKSDELLWMVSRGATVHRLMTEQIRSLRFALPPLPEQQRIVALLDEAFAGLATAKANAERNLQNARAVFESHLESVFNQWGEGWVECALGDLIEIQNGYAFKSSEYVDSGYFVIRIGNVQDGEISLNNPRYIRLTDQRLERFVLEEGDILISLTGNIGRAGVIHVEHLPAVLNQRVARITVKNQSIDRDFLFRFLSSRAFREGLQEAGHGAAQQNVSTKEIESVLLSVPSRIEQRAAVDEFNRFDEEVDHLTQLYKRKLAALEELKKSLLQQAFSGEI